MASFISNSSWNILSNNTSLEMAVFTVAGSATLLSVIMTFYLVFRHMKHYIFPFEQRCIVRILLMVPFYSIVSWVAIVIGEYSLYFALVRDCYEAYVLYQCFNLFVHYSRSAQPIELTSTNGSVQLQEEIAVDDDASFGRSLGYYGERYFPFPLCCLRYAPGNSFFLHIKRGVLQYVFLKPILSAIAILLEILGLYHTGSFELKYGYVWIAIILNVSAALSFFFLLTFYELIKKDIAIHQPLLKLISIKILVFIIFWQSFIIGMLYYFHAIPAFFGWGVARSSETVLNTLICMEMAGLSFFNIHAFPYESYRTESGEHTLDDALKNIKEVINHSDMVDETVDAFSLKRAKNAYDKRND